MTGSSDPDAALRRRGPGRPWRPGVSGNPSGLTRDLAQAVAEARALASKFTRKSILRLAELLDDADPRMRYAAATALLDRAGVGPLKVEADRIELAVGTLDVEDAGARLAARLEAIAPRSGGPSSLARPTLPAAAQEVDATSRATVEPSPVDATPRAPVTDRE
jgi:hypothetical protein